MRKQNLCSGRRITLLTIILNLNLTCYEAYHLPRPDLSQRGARARSFRSTAKVTNRSQQDATFEGEPAKQPGSNFWYSVIRKDSAYNDNNNHGIVPSLPTLPTLDRDGGELPPEAYIQLGGNLMHHPKKTCRLSIALNLLQSHSGPYERTGTSEIIRNMQAFIDSGLTSFQIKSSPLESWAEENVYGRLRRETPASAMERCQLTVPLVTPSEGSFGVSSVSIRETVLESLGRIGGDAIDNIQLQCEQESPYHLDVLDCLEDLKREGLVLSVSSRNAPNELLRSADKCGFHIDSNQIDFNLLDTTAYNLERRLTCEDLNTPLLLSSPLAGGLLTRCGLKSQPYSWQLRPKEGYYIKEILPRWAERHADASSSLWSSFQSILMDTLHDIALKHGVSVASVNLRWSLQLDYVASSVVTCRLCEEDGDSGGQKTRSQALREVFTFNLDEEDMTRLWESSSSPPSLDKPGQVEAENVTRETFGEDNSPIDFSNQDLWL